MLTAEGLAKSYGGKVVLDGVSLTVPAGMVTGFLGANGAGKTTVMRLMLGLVRGAGTTTFLGRRLHEWGCPARVVGASLGQVAGHPHHRIVDHLGMVAAGAGIHLSAVDRIIERVGLSDARRTRISQLSLGMNQRVGLAQALLGDPPILILDEPANGLDPHAARWLRDTLRALAGEGRAVFVSSHLLADMQQLADSVVVLARGRRVAEVLVKDLSTVADATVVVECPAAPRLAALVAEAGATSRLEDGRLHITGMTRQQLGDLAVRHSLPLHWLSSREISLEDFYLSVATQEHRPT